MRAEIKGYHCADVPNLEAWQPTRTEEVYLPLELNVGPVGEGTSDLFQIVIATPQAIRGRPDRRRCKLLVVQEYNWPDVQKTLEGWVSECERQGWMQIVDCLRRDSHGSMKGWDPDEDGINV